ncbi:ABC transporter ATP-binding protein [Caminibacter mediatlanticus]|uniref:Spermidine/putrescine ABC transporter, ATP-binding protein (PotA) n=1 Tax=Caminibacter mediatlanticus TB-2 TaxID=391592 RepID=A0AAI9AFQ7_9BACT|nr:ABC transporter ATP-binding protein [Caminibacter mediatlanticus]EDM23321.1 spermidine/putrescine ABC transporter, ATP-binding protein (potA) [Caminibacter mediatlanticus TB-2]
MLEIKNISKKFDEKYVLKKINFTIKKGEFFSILGPSGSGKTTLLRMIGGFTKIGEGDILINKKSIKHLPPEKRDVNIVFQNLALFPMMNVFENVAFGLKRKKLPKNQIKKEVLEILEKVGLKGYEKRKINELSGGQKQRVAIARSLIMKPSILLLDEPLSALDRQLREHMKLELKILQKEFEITFVYITHDQSEAMEMSDRVCVINEGSIDQLDTPYNLYNHPKTAFVASFIGENNKFELVFENNKLTTKNGWILPINQKAQYAFIRPESIKINPQNCEITLKAKVNAILYDGAKIRYSLISEYGDEITLITHNEAKKANENDEIIIGFNKNDIKIY